MFGFGAVGSLFEDASAGRVIAVLRCYWESRILGDTHRVRFICESVSFWDIEVIERANFGSMWESCFAPLMCLFLRIWSVDASGLTGSVSSVLCSGN